MAEKIPAEAPRYVKFKKPVELNVNKEAWEKVCDELQKKSTIGTFIFMAVGIVVSMFFGGALVLIACIGLAVFLNMGVRKRFKHLRSLGEHSFTVSSSEIVHTYEGKKQIIPFQKIKSIEFQNWGLELDTQKNRKMADKEKGEGLIMIPREVNDYGRVIATFEALKKN